MGAATARVIDPRGITSAVLAGIRCAYANCRRHLGDDKTFLGCTPDGTPVFACPDHEAVEQ